jgi:AcrR family transcriptional regulator
LEARAAVISHGVRTGVKQRDLRVHDVQQQRTSVGPDGIRQSDGIELVDIAAPRSPARRSYPFFPGAIPAPVPAATSLLCYTESGTHFPLKSPNKMTQSETSLRRFMPRRAPRQLRSRILFDKILATAKVLFEKHGFAYVTTNRIADEANISIGSVYQYFKNCESIALAVYEQAAAKAAQSMKRRILQSMGLPLEKSIPKHIAWAFEVYEKDRYALLHLIHEVPELRNAWQPLSIGTLMDRTGQIVLEQHLTGVSRSVIARKAYILDKSVTGIISQYLEDRPEFLSRSEAVAETTELVYRYLASLDAQAKPSPRSSAGSRVERKRRSASVTLR